MLTDGSARGMTDEVGAVDVERVHELQQIACHVTYVGDERARTRTADPAMIMQDYAEMLGKLRDLLHPEPTAAAEAGDQQQRLPLSVLLDIQLGMPDGHAPAHGLATNKRTERLCVHAGDCLESAAAPANALWP
jgi:hypothetical protein